VRAHSTDSELVDLSGWWRAHESDPDLVKTFADAGTPDEAWSNVRVPHHWRSETAFATSDGPVLYRKGFTCDPAPSGARAFLELDGVFYYGDVWLDGEYLGATEGSFVRHAFEIGDALAARTEHVLAIEVACPPQRDAGAQRTITAPFWHSPLVDPDCNPGGLWQPVRVVRTGPVRIADARVLCIEASVERGRLDCHLTLDAGTAPCEARLHAVVRDPAGAVMLEALREVTLAAGTNELSWLLAVEEPPRWWPRALGPQHLCALELEVEAGGATSDALVARTAFREVRRRGWQFAFNGEPMYLKGASYGPARALPGDADDALVRADVGRAVDANLDFLRVYTHIAAHALYDAADEAGLLLWQDFPMHGGYARGVRKQAARQARHMVSRLGHHPSVFVWCAHDAPLGDDTTARLIAGATAPTWGKEVLDRSVARAIGRADGTRPVLRNSGAGSDAHAWFGWRHGDLAGLAGLARVVPRLAGFVSAFGAQSVPPNAGWMQPDRWPDLDWDDLGAHHAMERGAFDAHVPAADAKSFDEWREATQAYQAALLQLQIEDLRRCKRAPSGGFAMFAFADAAPLVGFGVLDHERAPKRAYASLRDACRPVLPMVDPRTGHVHVVNDGRVALEDARIEVTVDGRARRWTGDVGADAIAFIGTVEIGDAVDVEAVLAHPRTGEVANRYPLLLLEAGRQPTMRR
jgi:beta-mannosidase